MQSNARPVLSARFDRVVKVVRRTSKIQESELRHHLPCFTALHCNVCEYLYLLV